MKLTLLMTENPSVLPLAITAFFAIQGEASGLHRLVSPDLAA
jgi:hypothetical protein